MKITEKTLLHNAVVGASIALQVQKWLEENYGSPGYPEMRRFMEVAEATADMALEVEDFEPKEEE